MVYYFLSRSWIWSTTFRPFEIFWLSHSSLVAKLSTHRCNMKALCFINKYLGDHKQITKISDTFGSREEIFYGVSQRIILRSLVSSTGVYDVFAIMNQHGIANYADENTPYVTVKT